MEKKFGKLIIAGAIILFFLIILAVFYFFHKARANENEAKVFPTYEEAVDRGMKEFGDKAVILKDVKIEDSANNTNLIFYAANDLSSIYAAKITAEKDGFRYEKVTPTGSWTDEDNAKNVAFHVPVMVNGQTYYVLMGTVDEAHRAYNNMSELQLDENRIFIEINTENKNEVRFEKSN